MAEPHTQRELDGLLKLARAAEPPAVGALAARRMVRHAQAAALQRGQGRKLTRYALLCAAALLALVAGFAWQRAPAGTNIAVGASDRPLRIALKTGDSLLLAPGSELAVLEQRSERRRVRLARGRVLFDVAKLAAGEGFEVEAESARVRVLGTIFSVEVSAGRTLVRVYEGRVAVGGRVLAAPGVWVSRGALPQYGDALFEPEAQQLVLVRQGVQPGRSSPAPTQPVTLPAALANAQAPAAAPALPAGLTSPAAVASSQVPAALASPAGLAPLAAQREAGPQASTRMGSGASEASALRADRGASADAATAQPSSAPGQLQPSSSVAAGSAASADPHSGPARPRSSAPPTPTASEEGATPSSTATSVAAQAAAFELDRARALLAAGDAQGALSLARQHAARDDEALLLVADASRALGRHREARAHYRKLAERGADPLRTRAAFAAAQLSLHALGDPADALSLIAAFALAADDAPLRERATALEVDALLALGRRWEARLAAERYLAREPETETSRRMREVLGK
jgi:hypothetical protein